MAGAAREGKLHILVAQGERRLAVDRGQGFAGQGVGDRAVLFNALQTNHRL